MLAGLFVSPGRRPWLFALFAMLFVAGLVLGLLAG